MAFKMWNTPLKTLKTDNRAETMKDVSLFAAARLHRTLDEFSEEDLYDCIMDLVLSVYTDASQIKDSYLVSWFRRYDLSPTDAVICAMDRIVGLNVYGLYHATSSSDYLNVLGFWEFQQHN